MEIMGMVVGSLLTVVGMYVSYLISRSLQNKEFAKQDNEQKELIRNLLRVLYNDLKDYYQKLFTQATAYCRTDNIRGTILNYQPFVFENKRAIWPLLVQHKLFGVNREVFASINEICQKLELTNRQIDAMIPQQYLIDQTKEEVRIFRDNVDAIKRCYVPSNDHSEISFETTELSKKLKKIIEEI